MVKHDGVQRGLMSEVMKRFEQRGLKLVGTKFVKPSSDLIKKHYAEHDGKPFFAGLIEYGTSGPVLAMVWQGFEAVKVGRSLTGATKPVESLPGTIRGDFGLHVGRNLIHASDSNDSAKREIGLWFTDAELHDWSSCANAWIYEGK
jgi:nucleoside-diphosphate kinase